MNAKIEFTIKGSWEVTDEDMQYYGGAKTFEEVVAFQKQAYDDGKIGLLDIIEASEDRDVEFYFKKTGE